LLTSPCEFTPKCTKYTKKRTFETLRKIVYSIRGLEVKMTSAKVSGNRANLWHDGAGAGKVLTTAFVADVEFYTTDEADAILEIALGGTAPTSVILQLEESFDRGTNWTIVTDLPNQGVLDGSVSAQPDYQILLKPRTSYRISAKRVGGDGTSTALIKGSFRVPLGDSARTANKDYVPPAYDSTNGADDVTVLNIWNKYHDGAPIANVTTQPDATYDYYLDLDGVRELNIQLGITIGGGTVTVTFEGTTWDDGTADSSCTYIDVTNAMYGAANFTASGMMFDTNRLAGGFKYGHIKVVKAGGGTADWRIDARGVD
jgi:hypothetical protein